MSTTTRTILTWRSWPTARSLVRFGAVDTARQHPAREDPAREDPARGDTARGGAARRAPAPIYREHELFGTAALPAHAGIYVLDGDSEVHGHDFLEIAVVGGGTGCHVTAQGRSPVRTGAVFVLRPGAWHGFAGCDRLVVANACVSPAALRTDLAFLRNDPGVRDLLWTAPFAAGRHGVLETVISPADGEQTVEEIGVLQHRLAERPDDRLLLLGHLVTVLGRLVGGRSPAGDRTTHPAIAAATSRLDSAPEHPWRLDELARAVNLDPAYLTRLFRRHVGLPPIAYLARVRAEKAAGLLASTTLPAARVGALVGWPDPTYFARRFHALVGLTPTAYRRRVDRDGGTHERGSDAAAG
jgi:AraC-like DNA-binding protein